MKDKKKETRTAPSPAQSPPTYSPIFRSTPLIVQFKLLLIIKSSLLTGALGWLI
jgi:hypothetical protein